MMQLAVVNTQLIWLPAGVEGLHQNDVKRSAKIREHLSILRRMPSLFDVITNFTIGLTIVLDFTFCFVPTSDSDISTEIEGVKCTSDLRTFVTQDQSS